MTQPIQHELAELLPKFEREERFIVVKRKHLTTEKEVALRRFLRHQSIDTVECVVVESDWPEYETVWRMIEDRVTGNTRPPPTEMVDELAKHWVTDTGCVHYEDGRGDNQFACWCGWTSERVPTVGDGVRAWAEHVAASLHHSTEAQGGLADAHLKYDELLGLIMEMSVEDREAVRRFALRSPASVVERDSRTTREWREGALEPPLQCPPVVDRDGVERLSHELRERTRFPSGQPRMSEEKAREIAVAALGDGVEAENKRLREALEIIDAPWYDTDGAIDEIRSIARKALSPTQDTTEGEAK